MSNEIVKALIVAGGGAFLGFIGSYIITRMQNKNSLEILKIQNDEAMNLLERRNTEAMKLLKIQNKDAMKLLKLQINNEFVIKWIDTFRDAIINFLSIHSNLLMIAINEPNNHELIRKEITKLSFYRDLVLVYLPGNDGINSEIKSKMKAIIDSIDKFKGGGSAASLQRYSKLKGEIISSCQTIVQTKWNEIKEIK